jgi:hypothetical protein
MPSIADFPIFSAQSEQRQSPLSFHQLQAFANDDSFLNATPMTSSPPQSSSSSTSRFDHQSSSLSTPSSLSFLQPPHQVTRDQTDGPSEDRNESIRRQSQQHPQSLHTQQQQQASQPHPSDHHKKNQQPQQPPQPPAHRHRRGVDHDSPGRGGDSDVEREVDDLINWSENIGGGE